MKKFFLFALVFLFSNRDLLAKDRSRNLPERATNSHVNPFSLASLLRINDVPIFPPQSQIHLNSLEELIAFVSKQPDQKLAAKKSVVVINFRFDGMKIDCDEDGCYSVVIGSKTYLFPTHIDGVFFEKNDK